MFTELNIYLFITITESILLLVDYYYSQKVSSTQSSVVDTSACGLLLLPEGIIHPVISGRYFCLWTTITPRRYHPPSHQWSILLLVDYYYSQKVSSTQSSVVDTSSCGLLLLPEGIIHPVISGRYFCLWTTITPRRYHPPSHQWLILLLVDYYYSQKVSSTQSLVVDTSACGLLLLPEGIIHPVISGRYFCLWTTITPRRYHPPSHQWSILLLVDYYYSQKVSSTQLLVVDTLLVDYYYSQKVSSTQSSVVDTSACGLLLLPEGIIHPVISGRYFCLVPEGIIHPVISGRYFCLWTTITPRRYHPPSHQWSILLLVDNYYSQKVSSTQSLVVDTSACGLLLLPEGIIHPVISGRYFCLWTTITPRRYHPPSHQWSILLLVDYYYSQKVSSTQSSVVDTSACGLLLLPEGIIHPVISASELILKLFGFPIF